MAITSSSIIKTGKAEVNHSSHTLLRAVYDAVTLGLGDSLSLTIQVSVAEG